MQLNHDAFLLKCHPGELRHLSTPSTSRCISPRSKPLKRPASWSSYHLGLKRGMHLTACSVVESQLGHGRAEGSVHCPRAPTKEPCKGRRPENRHSPTKHETVFVSGLVPVLAWPCPGSRVAGSPARSSVVPVCLFFLLLFLSIGRGRHVPAPGWEGRRVKRRGTDPRTGTGRRPKDQLFQVPLYVRLSCVPHCA